MNPAPRPANSPEGYTITASTTSEIRLRGLRTWLDTHRDQMIIAICVLLGC